MPNTKFQSFIFTLLMVFFMVYCMTVYNISLNSSELSYQVFLTAIKEMWTEFIIVFLLIFFLITHLAKKLTFRLFNPTKDKPIFITLSMQSFTVVFIVPVITLIVTFLHNGFNANWFIQWIQLFFVCFPTAFFIQIFLVGPLVRFIFRRIFYKNNRTLSTYDET